jgi:aspartyl aminopeptidase
MIDPTILEKSKEFGKIFVDTINQSTSAFNFVETAKSKLLKENFKQIYEKDSWSFKPGDKLFYTRNNSALFAFTIGKKYDPLKGCFKIIGAHTDSPSLRIAPNSYNPSEGFERYNIETYGGGLWHTWLDRDLSVCGKVVFYNKEKQLSTKIIKCNEPIFFIPNCPPHLKSAEEKSALKINNESHLKPLIATVICNLDEDKKEDKNKDKKLGKTLRKVILNEVNKNLEENNKINGDDIVSYDLVLYDTQPSCLIGVNKEFVASGRMDNLGSSIPALYSMLDSSKDEILNEQTSINMIALFDNEEIGSLTFSGADSNFFYTHLKRIFSCTTDKYSEDSFLAFLARSFCISADLAHAFNPNYPEKFQTSHKNKVQQGIVVKINANGRYSSDSENSAIFKELAKKCGSPIQEFIVRQDSPCGTTIGPITTAKTGIKSVDVGIPQFAMHSIREFLGVVDLFNYKNVFEEFFKSFENVRGNLVIE